MLLLLLKAGPVLLLGFLAWNSSRSRISFSTLVWLSVW